MPTGALVGLRMLRELDLSGNQLGQLASLAFQSLDQLLLLNLSGCSLRLESYYTFLFSESDPGMKQVLLYWNSTSQTLDRQNAPKKSPVLCVQIFFKFKIALSD